MESSTPLTRCNVCNTVFEVPQAILDSVDSRVRCGECLQVFDAHEHLHEVEQVDLSVPTERETLTVVYDDADSEAHTESVVPATSDGEAEAEQTSSAEQADIDLFGHDADLPLATFEDATIDAMQLDFELVDDYSDETLSQTVFSGDETGDMDASLSTDTIDVDHGDGVTTESEDEDVAESEDDAFSSRQQSVRRKNAIFPGTENRNFSLDNNESPSLVEFDFRDTDGDATIIHPSQDYPAVSDSAASPFPGQLDQEIPQAEADLDIDGDGVQVLQQTGVAPTQADSASALAEQAKREEQETLAAAGQGENRRGQLALWSFRALLSLFLLAIVGGLYGYSQRDELADKPLTRPAYQLWCLAKGCAVPARLDTSRLVVVEKKIFTHPSIESALLITIVLRNTAEFEQRYPVLFAWLSDSSRRTVASNEFEPAVYLKQSKLPADSVLRPGEQQRISLDVLDPGDNAVSLELSFR